MPWVAVLIAVSAVQIAAATYGGYLQQIMGESGGRRARADMGRAMLHSALPPLSRYRSGDVVSRFTTDAEALRDGVVHGYIQLAIAGRSLIGVSQAEHPARPRFFSDLARMVCCPVSRRRAERAGPLVRPR